MRGGLSITAYRRHFSYSFPAKSFGLQQNHIFGLPTFSTGQD
jgi:hypothetical protein